MQKKNRKKIIIISDERKCLIFHLLSSSYNLGNRNYIVQSFYVIKNDLNNSKVQKLNWKKK